MFIISGIVITNITIIIEANMCMQHQLQYSFDLSIVKGYLLSCNGVTGNSFKLTAEEDGT